MTETELNWLMNHEFARTAEDVIWRRTKLGLRLGHEEVGRISQFMAGADKVAAE